MPLSKEQLMIPRVMCIGGKEGEPNDTSGDFITGDILTQTVKKFCKWKSEKLKYTVYLDPDFVERFPHLFKPLPWWYGRTVEEMPLFVKCIKTPDQVHFPDEVFKVNWKLSHLGFSDRGGIVPNTDCYQPAGLSDYQEYQKQKEV